MPPAPKPVKLSPYRAPDLRPSAHRRGYTSTWQRARLGFLSANPLCVHCRADGQLVEATVVDHRIPHKGSHDLFWDRSNWQPLCATCHGRKTVAEDGGFGRPVKSQTEITVVAGAPASGKTSWAIAHAQPGDLVYDADALVSALTGLPAHDWPPAIIPFATAARDAILNRLSKPSELGAAFVLTSSPDHRQVSTMAERMNAKLHIVSATESECLARAAADPERRDSANRWPPLIREWFKGWSDYVATLRIQ